MADALHQNVIEEKIRVKKFLYIPILIISLISSSYACGVWFLNDSISNTRVRFYIHSVAVSKNDSSFTDEFTIAIHRNKFCLDKKNPCQIELDSGYGTIGVDTVCTYTDSTFIIGNEEYHINFNKIKKNKPEFIIEILRNNKKIAFSNKAVALFKCDSEINSISDEVEIRNRIILYYIWTMLDAS